MRLIILIILTLMIGNVEARNMKISQDGIDLIKYFEGLAVTSYQDVVGVWTIGYGHTKTAAPNQVISQFEAEELLREDVRDAELCVIESLDVDIAQHQFDALVSFVYNLGCINYNKSTLLQLINKGKIIEAVDQFRRWSYAGGKFLRGLERRRLAEAKLFSLPLN